MVPQSFVISAAAPTATPEQGWKDVPAGAAPAPTVSDLDDEIVALQQRRILDLQKKVDALAADKSTLEGSVRDLREKNVSLAKKLARCSRRCRFARRCPSLTRSVDTLSSTSSDDGDNSDGSGGDAAAVDALECLVKMKDEQLHDLECRSKASEEMIAILRGQLTALLREKCDVEKNLRRDVDRAERKNAALKGSVEACDSTIESLRGEVDEMRATADERARKAEEERDALQREFEAERRDAKETISKLRERLGQARREEPLTSSAIDAAHTSAAAVASEILTEIPPSAEQRRANDELEEEREASQQRTLELQQQLRISEEKLQQARDENSALREFAGRAGGAVSCENFNAYYEPVVKNLTFLLEMRDRTIRDVKTERDEAMEEAEWYRRQNERLTNRGVTMAENLHRVPSLSGTPIGGERSSIHVKRAAQLVPALVQQPIDKL